MFLAARALSFLPEAPGQSILDLGCGIGDLANALKTRRPTSNVAAIDFSALNVLAARARSDAVAFHLGDYLHWQGGPFDLIVSDSVLHLIEAPLEILARKIAADLRPRGLLIATVPNDAPRNQALLLVRRLYKRMPKSVDNLMLRLAARLYPTIPQEVLADRLPYMRSVPRLFGRQQQAQFAQAGLTLEYAEQLPDASFAKPRHFLMVWRRAPPV